MNVFSQEPEVDLSQPYQGTNSVGKPFWRVRPLVVVYPSHECTEMYAEVMFLDGRSGKESDIIVIEGFSAMVFESWMKPLGIWTEREYSLWCTDISGREEVIHPKIMSPEWAMEEFARWVAKDKEKWVRNFFKRIHGWKHTGQVYVDFQHSYPAGCYD